MTYTAFETDQVITDYNSVSAAGFKAVGVYIGHTPERCPFTMSQGLIAAGLSLWTVFEQLPLNADSSYFTEPQADIDARKLLTGMAMHGQPPGSYAGPAIDLDTSYSSVAPYLIRFHDLLKSSGYLHMPYGSGNLLQECMDAGYAHVTAGGKCGWLSGSTGWSGYEDFKFKAAIVQVISPSVEPLGLSGDYNIINDPAVLWR